MNQSTFLKLYRNNGFADKAWYLDILIIVKSSHATFKHTSMATFSRGLRASMSKGEYICARCAGLSTSAVTRSGHNRWSKIKHDKGAADMKKNVQRSQFSKDIYLASKCKKLS